MDNIWSDNKYINLSINILLFLTGINFLHYGQLILPIICFILFVDNKLKFKVNSPLTFIVLCLFGVSFYAFSYQLGFYSVMGFTCPMAYYIGSNMKRPSEDNIKKIIYLFAFSMGCHVILNSIFEYIVHGYHGFFMSTTHYDFWTREKISNTSTAINGDLLIGCFYYLIFHEKNKKIKALNIINLILSMFYLSVIGRRTPVVMLVIAFVLSYIYEAFVLKNSSEKLRKRFLIIAVSAAALVLLIVTVFSLNLFGLKDKLIGFHIIRKFSQGFINDQRFELYFGSFKLMPQYLWGGQHISTILGEQVHDFWIDIYDYAGIVSCGIMIVYSLIFVKDLNKMFRSSKINNNFKILMVGISTCIILQMFLEPVMTGASLYLLVSIIIHGLFERLTLNE